MRLYLLRHGETVWNKELRYQGQTDIGLSELGIEQSAALAGRLANMADPGCPIFSSDLGRAHQSATIISAVIGSPVTLLPDLREASFGAWEGMSFDSIAEKYPREWEQWRADPATALVPGAEDRAHFRRRVIAAIEHIAKTSAGDSSLEEELDTVSADGGSLSGPQAILVTHGGVIKTIVAHALGLSFDSYWKLRIDNCSLSIIDIYDQGSILSSFNDTAHILDSGAPAAGRKVL